MELYTLDPTFMREHVIDEYMSAIWTERFTKNGDMELILPVTLERIIQLQEGKFVACLGSDEIMIIESVLIDAGLMTVKGKTLEAFFNERYLRNSADLSVNEWAFANVKPGNILSQIVQAMVVDATSPGLTALGGVLNQIPFLVVGDIDQSDPAISKKVPFGPMYDAMLPIAETAKLGMKIFLSRADPFGYELTFTVYKGVNRTSAQLENNLVRFSPAEDSLTNLKEVRSIAGYKNVVYMFPPSWSSATAPVVSYSPGVDPAVTGFNRRVLVAQASDISEDQVTGGVTLLSLMQQKATDALANNNYTKLVDGEVVPQPEFIYGQDYKLGDIIELVGMNGIPQNAQITEYIRSKDSTGERAYPTVSVVD